jgi:hypothetical protein
MSGFKMCPRCRGIASWSEQFQGYICQCGYIERTPVQNPNETQTEEPEQE